MHIHTHTDEPCTHLAELRVERRGDVVVGLHAVGHELGRQVPLRHHAEDLAVHRDDGQRVEALRRQEADRLLARHAGRCKEGRAGWGGVVGHGWVDGWMGGWAGMRMRTHVCMYVFKYVPTEGEGSACMHESESARTDGDGRLEVQVLHPLRGPPRLVLGAVDQPLGCRE